MEKTDRQQLEEAMANYREYQGMYLGRGAVVSSETTDRIWRELQRTWAIEDWLRDMIAESEGIVGWHQNGDILRWGEAGIDRWEGTP